MNQRFDAIGNLLEKSDVGVYAYESTAHPGAATAVGGRPLEYDANGAVVASLGRTFDWSLDGKLKRAVTPSATVEYVYGHSGARVVKKTTAASGHASTTVYLGKYAELRDGRLVKYVYLGDARIARIGGTTPKALAVAAWVAGPGTGALGGLGLLAAMLLFLGRGTRRFARASLAVSLAFLVASCTCGPPGPPPGTLFYVVNHLGSTVAQLDVDSKVVGESNFDVWGNPIALTDEAYGFTGAEYDVEAGLQYLGSRYYDVRLGRFLSADAFVLDKTDVGLKDPQLLNVYAYARNSPAGYKDPDGKCAVTADGIDCLGPALTANNAVFEGMKQSFAQGDYGSVMGGAAKQLLLAVPIAAGFVAQAVVAPFNAAGRAFNGFMRSDASILAEGAAEGAAILAMAKFVPASAPKASAVPPTVKAAKGITSGSQVTEDVIRQAMKDAPLKSQQAGGVSLPKVQGYVNDLLAGKTPPPIKVDGNMIMIVDGNHRYIAGQVLGQPPPVQPWAGGSPGSAVPWETMPIDPKAWP